jgi:hypothetical protein
VDKVDGAVKVTMQEEWEWSKAELKRLNTSMARHWRQCFRGCDHSCGFPCEAEMTGSIIMRRKKESSRGIVQIGRWSNLVCNMPTR